MLSMIVGPPSSETHSGPTEQRISPPASGIFVSSAVPDLRCVIQKFTARAHLLHTETAETHTHTHANTHRYLRAHTHILTNIL